MPTLNRLEGICGSFNILVALSNFDPELYERYRMPHSLGGECAHRESDSYSTCTHEGKAMDDMRHDQYSKNKIRSRISIALKKQIRLWDSK